MAFRLPSFEEWLTVQFERSDGTGRFSRLWLETLPSGVDFEMWLQERRSSVVFAQEVDEAVTEFNAVIEGLQKGEFDESFPESLCDDQVHRLFEERGEYHRENPEVSAGEYLESLQKELANELSGKTVVYLDTLYWSKLRGLLEI